MTWIILSALQDWWAVTWKWLSDNSDSVQALSGIVFGIAASLIAWFAYRVSIRENFGWPPFTVLKHYSLGGGNGKTEMNVEFQLWNRHRYPIIVHDIILSYKLARFKNVEDYEDPMSEAWSLRSERAIGKWFWQVVGPSAPSTFDLNFVVDSEHMLEAPTIEVAYLDTIKNKVRRIRTVGETFSKLRSDYGWWDGLKIYLWPELRREKRYQRRLYASFED